MIRFQANPAENMYMHERSQYCEKRSNGGCSPDAGLCILYIFIAKESAKRNKEIFQIDVATSDLMTVYE